MANIMNSKGQVTIPKKFVTPCACRLVTRSTFGVDRHGQVVVSKVGGRAAAKGGRFEAAR